MKTPIVTASHLCEQLIVDQQSGRLSLINMFNSLRLAELPAVVPHFVFFVSFTDGPRAAKGRVSLFDPNQHRLWSEDITVQFSDPVEAAVYLRRFYNTTFTVYGVYTFEIEIGGEIVLVRRFGVLQPV